MFEKDLNQDIIDMLSKVTMKQFNYLMRVSETKRNKKYDNKEEFKKLKYFLEEYKKEGFIKQEYNQRLDVGRQQAQKPSIQRLFNGLRGILCDGVMIDLDIKACHNHIILNLCKKYDIECDHLSYYIQNRDECLNDLMEEYKIDKGEAKMTFIKSLNKEDRIRKINNKTVIKKSFFYDYDKQTSVVVQKLSTIYQHDSKWSEIFNKKREELASSDSDNYNLNGKFTNLILQDMENEILCTAIDYLQKNGHEIGVKMFDGCMIYKQKNINYKDLIIQLNKLFIGKGDYKWAMKEHATDLKEHLLNLKLSDYFQGENIIDVVDYILENPLKDKLIRCQNLIYYMDNDSIYNNEDIIEAKLYKFISDQMYEIKEEGVKGPIIKLISKDHIKINHLCKGIMNKCNFENNFINDVWSYTQYKMFFNNGYYDFKKKEFVKGNFNKTFIKINKDFIKSNNTELRKEIYNKIFNPIFSINEDQDIEQRKQLLDYFLYIISHFMAGDVQMKKWAILQGFRNSGKGILADLIKYSFENYIISTNASNFENKKNSSDSQKDLYWIVSYQFGRLALCNEVSIADKKKLDGSLIKKFSSGGDMISARRNYENEREFRIQSGLLICCNDLPEIAPTDAMETCEEFEMLSKFIDNKEKKETKFKGYSYYPKDDTLKTEFITNPEVQMEFINIIFEYYDKNCHYPEKIQKENQIEQDIDNDYKKIIDLFTISTSNDDKIYNKKLRQILNNANIPFTLTKLRKLLKKQGAKDFREKDGRGLACLIYNKDIDESCMDDSDYEL